MAETEDMAKEGTRRDQLLSAYGARIGKWPDSRLSGWAGLLTNKGFRKRWRRERALDHALDRAYPRNVAIGNPERLLATMGYMAHEKPALRLGPGFAAIAAASLALGLALGSISDGGVFSAADAGFAGISDAAWLDVTGDSTFEEDVG